MTLGAVEATSNTMSDVEWQTRVETAAAYRIVHHHGWASQVYNHITARIPGTEALLINPFGHAYDEITPGNLVKIDIEGNKLDNSPHPINAAGYTIHSALHAARPDLQCVIHTHSQNATAICCLEEGFIPLTQMGCMFHGRIATHDFEGIALDVQERENLVADFGPDNHTMLLHNHGIIVTGPTIAHAITRLYHFEDCAGVQLKAMAAVAGGATLKRPRVEVVERTRHQFESGASQAGAAVLLPEWPAYLRMLDRRDPGWRDPARRFVTA
ncbi:MAG: class II aldolase/adducin family protein [Chromatiales bacterium]|jgi:ribulose-5-phosphate 4-epimerase/fuculose-1-phosphate aldolase|nr:class II aldolase/adducin family protein [Chromatiales bacterium]